MSQAQHRVAIIGLVMIALVLASCGVAMRTDLVGSSSPTAASSVSDVPDPADVADEAPVVPAPAVEPEPASVDGEPPIVVETDQRPSGSFDTDPPEDLAFADPDEAETLPAPIAPEAATAGASEAAVRLPEGSESIAAAWAAFEQSLRANLVAGVDGVPSVAELATFEQAALVVCAGAVTPKSAAAAFELDDAAERVLNRVAPAMCHLVPTGPGETPGPALGPLDWASLTELRWQHGAQWIDLDAFTEAAERACFGLEPETAMAASTAAQVNALLVHGECALVWND